MTLSVETCHNPGGESLREIELEIDSLVDVAEHHKQVIEHNLGYILHIARDKHDIKQDKLSSNGVALEDLYDPSKPTVAIFAQDSLPGLELTAVAANVLTNEGYSVPNVILVPWLDRKDFFSHDDNRGYLALHNVTFVTPENTFAHFTLDEPIMADMTDRAVLGVEVLEELQDSEIETLYTKEAWHIFESKTITQEVARLAGVRAAKSVEVSHTEATEDAICDFFEMVGNDSGVVVKPLRGKTGDGVQLFDEISREELVQVVKDGIKLEGPLVLEERIRPMKLKLTPDGPRQDWNVRAVVAGQFLDMYARVNVWGGPVNKAQGATAMTMRSVLPMLADRRKDKIKIVKSLINASNSIAEVLRGNVAGLDLTLDETGNPVLIEVNVGNFGGINTIAQLHDVKKQKLAASRYLISIITDNLNRLPSNNGDNTQSPIEVGYDELTSVLSKLNYLASSKDTPKESTSQLLDKVVRQMRGNGDISRTERVFSWYKVANIYSSLGDYDKAKGIIDDLTTALPDNHDVQRIAAELSIKPGTMTTETEHIDSLLSKNPFNTKLYALKVTHSLDSGDIAGALMSLKNGLEVNPDSSHLLYRSAFIAYELLKDENNGEEVDDEFLKLSETNARFESFEILAHGIDKYMEEGLGATQKYLLASFETRPDDKAAFAEHQVAVYRLLHNLAIVEGNSRLSRVSLAELSNLDQDLYEAEATDLFTRKDIAEFKPEFARFAASLGLENGFFSHALLAYKSFSEEGTPPLHSYLLRRNIATTLLNKGGGLGEQNIPESKLIQRTCQVIDLIAQEDLKGARIQTEEIIGEIEGVYSELSTLGLKTLLYTILVELKDSAAINQLIPEIIDEKDNQFSMEIVMATDRLYAQD